MYPQSELDNYKLQVQLLQEKLQRSEENRNQLEHKLDHILQKRQELDKKVRSKHRQKYQEFLDEQQKRNERNKLLLQMLERVDQQTAALSVHSERLKMMKLQYEMYFAKLVQNQTMRCLQQTAAIPYVLVPTAQAMATAPQPQHEAPPAAPAGAPPSTVMPIISNEPPTLQPLHQFAANPMPGTTPITAITPITPARTELAAATYCLTPRINNPASLREGADGGAEATGKSAQPYPSVAGYPTMAVATPLQHPFSSAAVVAGGLGAYECLPVGAVTPYLNSYTPAAAMAAARMSERLHQYESELLSSPTNRNGDNYNYNTNNTNNSNKSTTNAAIDEMPTLRTLDDDYFRVAADVARLRGTSTSATATTLAPAPAPPPSSAPSLAPSPATTTPAVGYLHCPENDNGNFGRMTTSGRDLITTSQQQQQQQPQQQQEQQLLAATAAHHEYSSAAMTFDKLPKMALTDAENSQGGDYFGAAATPTVVAAAGAAAAVDKVGGDFDDVRRFTDFPVTERKDRNPRSTARNGNGDADENGKLLSPKDGVIDGGGSKGNANISEGLAMAAAAAATSVVDVNQRQKIDGAWQSAANQQPLTNTAHSTTDLAGTKGVGVDADDSNIISGTGGFATNDVTGTPTRPPPKNEVTADAAVTPPSSAAQDTPGHVSHNPAAAAVTTSAPAPTLAPAPAQTSAKMSIENIENAIYGELVNPPEPTDQRTQSLLEGLVTEPHAPADSLQQQAMPGEPPELPLAAAGKEEADAATTSASFSSTSYNQDEPTYATIEETTNAEVYQEPSPENNYPSSEYPENPEQQQPQEYSNVDYGNYDTTQYDANAYGTNAYPGYTYDETTGQYTADPTQQYATDQIYAGQEYEQQQYDPNQQDGASYDYGNYAQDDGAYNAVSDPSAEGPADPPVEQSPEQSADVQKVPAEDITPQQETQQPKVVKPTSILSTAADKQAALASEAHKKKKRVNFVESSDTDESLARPANPVSSESDFEFSTSGEAPLKTE